MVYYDRYDDHYRTLYAKGFKYWCWHGPEDAQDRVLERIVSRIMEAMPNPQGIKIIELGCGEAPWAVPLVQLGVKYTGIDYSPHAIAKARERAKEHGLNLDFRVMDVLEMDKEIGANKYEVVFDQRCLQMFVVDRDRRKYLANVKQLMGRESAFILTDQGMNEEAYEGEIRTVEEYEEIFEVDLKKPHPSEAWDGAEWVPVELPNFACRHRSRQGYVAELEGAGFKVNGIYWQDVGESAAFDFILTL